MSTGISLKKRRMAKRTTDALWRGIHGSGRDRRSTGKRIESLPEKGDQQFTVDGRNAEITVDLVLQTRAKMSENKVNGPDDAVLDDQAFAVGEDLHNYGVLPRTFFWVRWMHPARGRLWNWFSWGNQTRNQRRGSGATGPLRWHRWCRSGTRLVWWCVRKRSKSQRLGKDVTWEESTGVLVTNLSQKNTWNDRRKELPCWAMATWFDQQCLWQTWTSRQLSARRGRGIL